MKAYKKNVIIEKKGSLKVAYYLLDGEYIYCGQYTKSWADAEIKEDVKKEIEKRF